jgi:hypothetical protein
LWKVVLKRKLTTKLHSLLINTQPSLTTRAQKPRKPVSCWAFLSVSESCLSAAAVRSRALLSFSGERLAVIVFVLIWMPKIVAVVLHLFFELLRRILRMFVTLM